MTFAQISPTEFGTMIALFIGMLTGFYALVKFILASHEATQEKDRKERIALAKAVERMAVASEKTVEEAQLGRKAQVKGFAEAEKRNGHIAELIIQSKNGTIDAIQCMKVKQNVTEQHVETQVVEHEITK